MLDTATVYAGRHMDNAYVSGRNLARHIAARCAAARTGQPRDWCGQHCHGRPVARRATIPDWQTRQPLADVVAGSYNSLSCTVKFFAAFRLPDAGLECNAPRISMKKLLLSLIALCSFAVPVLAQQDTVVEEIVARVNNSIITRADLRRNQEQTAQDAKEQNLSQKQIEEREANSLRDLIDQQLLIQKAADLGISADADLVKRLDDLRKQMKAGSMEELQKLAEVTGRQLGGVQAEHQEWHSHPEGDRLRGRQPHSGHARRNSEVL